MNKRRDVLHCSRGRSHNLEGICVLPCVLPRSDAIKSRFQISFALAYVFSLQFYLCRDKCRAINFCRQYITCRTLLYGTDRTHSEMTNELEYASSQHLTTNMSSIHTLALHLTQREPSIPPFPPEIGSSVSRGGRQGVGGRCLRRSIPPAKAVHSGGFS